MATFVQLASVAEEAEMWDDMRSYMSKRVTSDDPSVGFGVLDENERILFSDSFKNSIHSRRESIALLDHEYFKCSTEGQKELTKNYKSKVEAELAEICRAAVEMVDRLLPGAGTPGDKAFYLKMKADYFRYRAAASSEDNNYHAFLQDADAAYREAINQASSLHAAAPIRLQVALNYSVFQKEVLQQTAEATNTAMGAISEAQAAGMADGYRAAMQAEFPGSRYGDENDQHSILTSLDLLHKNLELWAHDGH